MDNEFNAILENDTWELIPRNPCNDSTLIFILIRLNQLNYELIKLSPAFQSSIFPFRVSIFYVHVYFCMLRVESTE